jgi:hypothetical protein
MNREITWVGIKPKFFTQQPAGTGNINNQDI